MLINDTSISTVVAGNSRVQFSPQSMRYGTPNVIVITEASATDIKDTSRTLGVVCVAHRESGLEVTQTVKRTVSHLRASGNEQRSGSDSKVSVNYE